MDDGKLNCNLHGETDEISIKNPKFNFSKAYCCICFMEKVSIIMEREGLSGDHIADTDKMVVDA